MQAEALEIELEKVASIRSVIMGVRRSRPSSRPHAATMPCSSTSAERTPPADTSHRTSQMQLRQILSAMSSSSIMSDELHEIRYRRGLGVPHYQLDPAPRSHSGLPSARSDQRDRLRCR